MVLFRFKKFILGPIDGIVGDVIRNVLKRFVIPNDVVVKMGLPLKIKIQSVGLSGYGGFVGTHN
jgi:hypothetical protein